MRGRSIADFAKRVMQLLLAARGVRFLTNLRRGPFLERHYMQLAMKEASRQRATTVAMMTTAERYRWHAETESRGQSDVYYEWASTISEEAEMMAMIERPPDENGEHRCSSRRCDFESLQSVLRECASLAD